MRLPLLLALLPAPALAQVTAEDVWAATEASWEVWGVDVTGTPSRDGAALTVGGIAARGALPLGMGALRVAAPDLVLTERGDGTVLVETANPAVSAVALTVRLPGQEVTATLPVSVVWEGREMMASGTPDAVTFTLASGRVDVAAGPLALAGLPDRPAPGEAAAELRVRAGIASARVVSTVRPAAEAGGLVRIESTADYGETVSDLTLGVPGVFVQRSTGRWAPSSTTLSASLPSRGVPILQLAAALRDGLSVEAASTWGEGQTLTVTDRPDRPSGESWGASRGGSATLGLDAAGLAVRGESAGFEARATDAIPALGPGAVLGYGAGATTYELALPLLAGDGQRLALVLAARDATLDAATWARLDPTGALPRDPGSLTLSIEQSLDLPFDPVAPLAWGTAGARAARGEVPLGLGILRARVNAAGAGAWVEGEALFDFDESDLATLDGFPLPQGRATATLSGHGALLDALVAGGILPAAEAEAVRAGIARTFRPAPDGSAGLVFEIGPGTQRFLNGRPLD